MYAASVLDKQIKDATSQQLCYIREKLVSVSAALSNTGITVINVWVFLTWIFTRFVVFHIRLHTAQEVEMITIKYFDAMEYYQYILDWLGINLNPSLQKTPATANAAAVKTTLCDRNGTIRVLFLLANKTQGNPKVDLT